MRRLHTAFTWIFLLNKRILKQPMFLVLLALVPALVLGIHLISRSPGSLVTVALAPENADDPVSGAIIRELFRSNIDWDLTERLSRRDGYFIFVPKVAMAHRIHEGSTTNGLIRDTGRGKEDLEMLMRFWPRRVAYAIAGIYSRAEAENTDL